MSERRILASFASAVVGVTCIVTAGESTPVAGAVVAEDLVVTPSREERPEYTEPASVSVVTADDIRRAGYSSVPDALAHVGGLVMRSVTASPATAEVSLRGFGENAHGRVLVLMDGRRLNRPDMATVNWLQIPISQIERIEILRGGASALYGDHAVGGVINIITRAGAPRPTGELAVDVGSDGLNIQRGGVAGTVHGFSFAANAERQETDGYRERSAVRAWGSGGRMGYAFAGGLKVDAGLSYQNVYYEIPGWLTRTHMREDRRQSLNPDDASENEYVSATAGLVIPLGDDHRVDTGLLFCRKDMRSDIMSWFSFVNQTVDTIGVTPRYTWQGHVARLTNRITIGVDYYYDTLDLQRFLDEDRILSTTEASVTRETAGLYLRDALEFAPSWTLSVVGRRESARISADLTSAGSLVYDDDVMHHATAGEASLIRTFDHHSKLFVRAGTVYRYPFVDEQVSYFGFGADHFNRSLDPERGWTAEVGGGIRLGREFRGDLTLFRLDMSDEIAWDPLTMQNQNLDATSRHGIELEGIWEPVEQVCMRGSYAYTDATFRRGVHKGNEVPLVPQHKATLEAWAFSPPSVGITVGVIATYVGSCRLGGDVANEHDRLEDYVTTDCVLRYVVPRLDGLEAFLRVDNVADVRYATSGYIGVMEDGYYPAPGRTFRGGISYRF